MKLDQLNTMVEDFMSIAQANLLKYGRVAPIVFFAVEGKPEVVRPLNLKNQTEKKKEQDRVQLYIRTRKPDFAIVVSEAWMKKVLLKDRANYHPGDVEKSSEKVEIIVVVGGSKEGTVGIVQPFHRENGEIVWDEPFKEKMGFETAFFGTAFDEIAAAENPIFH